MGSLAAPVVAGVVPQSTKVTYVSKLRHFKRWVVAGLMFITLTGLTLVMRPHWVTSWLSERLPEVVFSVETECPFVAVTIDDGPDAETTPLILDVLERHRAKATFFVITDRIAGNEQLLSRATTAGHELGNHMTRDETSHRLPAAIFKAELLRADAELQKFDGDLRWFRPGGGWVNQSMLHTVHEAGYRTALGSVYPFDATLSSPRFSAWYIRTNVRPGSVIVLHNGGSRGQRTVDALERILPTLKRKGLTVTTLSTLADLADGEGSCSQAF